CLLLLCLPPPPTSTLFPYTTLFRSFAFKQHFVSHQGSDRLNPENAAPTCLIGGSFTVDIIIPADCLSDLSALHSIPHFLFIYSRSEEHTSELQSRFDLVCRLLLEKK